MKKIAVFASGSGTNAENIIEYFRRKTETSEKNDNAEAISVAVVLSNRPEAGVHARAKRLGVPSFTFSSADFRDGAKALAKLAEYQTDFIVLAGFMNLVSPAIIKGYEGRIVNIHPALLPKFGGRGMYGHHVHEAVVAAGETQTGITIHHVNEHYDEGTVIFQAKCQVLPDDTPETVAAKVHDLEYKYFPQVIEQVIYDRWFH